MVCLWQWSPIVQKLRKYTVKQPCKACVYLRKRNSCVLVKLGERIDAQLIRVSTGRRGLGGWGLSPLLLVQLAPRQ